MEKPLWMWVVFFTLVGALLVLDLGVLHRRQRVIGPRESLLTFGFYVAVSLMFGAWVWSQLGAETGSLFLTGYLVELSLSMDNIFVISLVLAYFRIPAQYQHRVLFWGILGVVILRGLMIWLGTEIVQRFEWVLYLFAAFLVFTGIKMLFMKSDGDPDIGKNPIVKFLRRYMRVTHEFHGEAFSVRQKNDKTGRYEYFITPLLLALIVIECVDLVFAVDSIPAILALTTDIFVVYTSNIFAILGLRSLYFALSFILDRFVYMKYALALVLVFIGSKVFVTDMLGLAKFPASVSLGVTLTLLVSGIVFSLLKTQETPKTPGHAPSGPPKHDRT